MIFYFIEWMREWFHWKVPAAFIYFSTRMILAAGTSLLFTLLLGPKFIQKLYSLKMGQPILSAAECPLLAELHQKKKETPTMGGILILSAMLVSLFFWMDWNSSFTWILLITTIVLGSLGAIDDYLKLRYQHNKGLSARKKMMGQLLFSSCLAIYLLCPSITDFFSSPKILPPPSAKEQIVNAKSGAVVVETKTLTTSEYMSRFYLPFKKEPLFVADGWLKLFSFFLIVFVITGASNGVNLTDGLDGLAAGCLVMVSIVLAVFAFLSNHMDLARYLHILYIDRSGEIAVYLFSLAGACLGFLWYNGYPAQVFMGDTGSLALGGILGVASILLRREAILALSGAIFVAEASSVILQVLSYRYRNKKRIFLCAPLHHHFEYTGWPETKVVVRFWIISLLFCMIAISSLKLQ